MIWLLIMALAWTYPAYSGLFALSPENSDAGFSDSTTLLREHRANKCGFGPAAETFLKSPQSDREAFFKQGSELFIHSFAASMGNRQFRISYYISGDSAVPPLDANTNFIPDWVEKAGEYLEHAYRLQVDTLGYLEPPTFAWTGGYMDIGVFDMGYYGETVPLVEYPANSHKYATQINLENDYVGGFYTHGYDALAVTCAHEFFHAVQLAYIYRSSDLWYYELSSTWMEDVAHDNVNDYYGYLGSFFSSPTRSLTETNGYESAHWNHFIAKRYGRDAVRYSWENMETSSAMVSIDNALRMVENSSDGLRRAFEQFALWNYFTGYRSFLADFYPEGSFYPVVQIPASPLQDESIDRSLPVLSACYYRRVAADSNYLSLEWDPGVSFVISSVIERSQAAPLTTEWHSDASVNIPDLLPGDTIAMIFANVDRTGAKTLLHVNLDSKQGGFSGDPVVALVPFPNPVRTDDAEFLFRFLLKADAKIRVQIFSVSGRKVFDGHSAVLPTGQHSGADGINWNLKDGGGRTVPSGVYVYRFTTDRFTKIGKLAVIR